MIRIGRGDIRITRPGIIISTRKPANVTEPDWTSGECADIWIPQMSEIIRASPDEIISLGPRFSMPEEALGDWEQ